MAAIVQSDPAQGVCDLCGCVANYYVCFYKRRDLAVILACSTCTDYCFCRVDASGYWLNLRGLHTNNKNIYTAIKLLECNPTANPKPGSWLSALQVFPVALSAEQIEQYIFVLCFSHFNVQFTLDDCLALLRTIVST